MELSDINNMSGRQFEELIYTIFIKMGFRANITQLTGDGGIDIEAYYDGPVFSGKYSVQCKRWKNVVGEPIIRDFYGAVVSANSLKGIIITSSSFSRQAYEFARGKNLELIDHDVLMKLINSFNEPIDKQQNLAGFLTEEDFDKDTYIILKERNNNEPKNLRLQEVMICFLSKAVLEKGFTSKNNGLLNELDARVETYITFIGSKNSNEIKIRKYFAKWTRAMICFVQGNVVQSFDLIKECQSMTIGWEMRRKRGQEFYFVLKSDTHDRFLYILFDLLGVEKLKDQILFKVRKGPGHGYPFDNLGNVDNGEIMQVYAIMRDITNHSEGLLAIYDFLIGWPVGLEIDSKNKRYIVEIIDISVRELLNRFLPGGIPEVQKQRQIIEASWSMG